MKKSKCLFLFSYLLAVLVGCWDVVNIEDRGFVLGTAIDLVEGTEKDPVFKITNQIVVPAGMVPESKEGGQGNKAFLNYTDTGKSIYSMDEQVTTSSSKVPYYGHLSILIVSEQVAQEELLFMKLMDTYIRDVNLRRGIKVVVSDGEAKKLLELTTPNHRLPVNNIIELLEKSSEEIGFLLPRTAGDIEEFHLDNRSYVLPLLQANDKLEYSLGAVFHGRLHKMVGKLEDKEMLVLEMIKGEHTLSIIDFFYNGSPFALKVIKLNRTISVDPANLEEIIVTVKIEVEGVIKESFSKEDFSQSQVIESIQVAVSDYLKERFINIVDKAQDDFGTDIFRIHEELRTKHYQTWEQIKDQWEQGEYYFKNVVFDFDVKTEIYSTGTTEQSK